MAARLLRAACRVHRAVLSCENCKVQHKTVKYNSSSGQRIAVGHDERRPNYELEYPAHFTENQEVLFPPEEPQVTGVEETTEGWEHVERLLPDDWVPPPPQHESYPTPSGWVPRRVNPAEVPYFVNRSRFHHLPVYLQEKNGGNRKFTLVTHVDGNIWALEKDLKEVIETASKRPAVMQVDEVCRKVRIKGVFLEEVSEFLLQKGF